MLTSQRGNTDKGVVSYQRSQSNTQTTRYCRNKFKYVCLMQKAYTVTLIICTWLCILHTSASWSRQQQKVRIVVRAWESSFTTGQPDYDILGWCNYGDTQFRNKYSCTFWQDGCTTVRMMQYLDVSSLFTKLDRPCCRNPWGILFYATIKTFFTKSPTVLACVVSQLYLCTNKPISTVTTLAFMRMRIIITSTSTSLLVCTLA